MENTETKNKKSPVTLEKQDTYPFTGIRRRGQDLLLPRVKDHSDPHGNILQLRRDNP